MKMDETSPIKTAVRRRIQWYQSAIVGRPVAGESTGIVRGGQFQSPVVVVVGSQNWLRGFVLLIMGNRMVYVVARNFK